MKALISLFYGIFLSVPLFAQLSARLDSVMKSHIENPGPGIALYVETGGKVLYKNAFGLANTSTGSLVDLQTNFRMASVSKQVTAMGILLLEKTGKLSFDDPLIKFLPEIPKHVSEKVLLRHLITHSSGILDYEALMDKNLSEQLLDRDILEMLKKQDTTYFEPGTHSGTATRPIAC